MADPQFLLTSPQDTASQFAQMSSPNYEPFQQTLLGRLPTELLEIVVVFLKRTDLPSVARISPVLRSLAERILYKRVVLPPRLKKQQPREVVNMEYWLPHRTLGNRMDIVGDIQTIDLCVRDKSYRITLPLDGGHAVPGSAAFETTYDAVVTESALASSILQRLPDLANLRLAVVVDKVDTTSKSRLKHKSVRALFPGFDERTAHLIHPPLFPAVRTITFYGDEFHWAFAKSPNMKTSRIKRPCETLPDKASEEVSLALEKLALCNRSSILNPDVERHKHVSAFLTHFPCLSHLVWRIRDCEWDMHTSAQENISADQQGSFDVLLGLLQPVAACLTTLDLSFDSELEDHSGMFDYLKHVLPSDGFKKFSNLRDLAVPHQCLFGSTLTPESGPSHLLPFSLQKLVIAFPRIALYDWFTRYPHDRKEIPNLKRISLQCREISGDSYEIFVFISRDHPGVNALYSLHTSLGVRYKKSEWKKEWNDYDLAALKLAAWQEKLGAPVPGIRIISEADTQSPE